MVASVPLRRRGLLMGIIRLAFSPRFIGQLSDLSPSALSVRTDTTRDASIFLRRREGWPAVQPRQAGGGLSARQDGARQASVRDVVRRLCARVRVGPPFDHASPARNLAVPRHTRGATAAPSIIHPTILPALP